MKTNRRKFILEAAKAGAAAAIASAGRASQPPSRPNILIIHTDEHRIDCLGAYGNSEIRTPAINALAADGVRFANSFCPYPVCAPSRYSFLSGLWVHEHQGWSNHCTLRPGTPTFASILRDAGYRTKAVGKMHFTPTYLDVGFDELELAEQDGPGRFDDDYHRHLKSLSLIDALDIQDQRAEYRGKAPPEYWRNFGAQASNLPEEHHSTTWIAERAMRTLERWTPCGNLLMVGFIKPHHPFDPPVPWDSRYNPEKISPLPGWIEVPLPGDIETSPGYFPHVNLNSNALRRVTAYYYATISQIDFHVDRMVRLLKEKGLYHDALIIFTSDHGDYMGFHHLLLKGNLMYDPVVKVPLIIKYPGREHRGTTSHALVGTVDVAPTILRRAGLRVGRNMGGLDLAQGEEREIIFADGGNQLMARTRRHKLIVRKPAEKSLFFDMEADPLELRNLYGEAKHMQEIARLTHAITSWRNPEISTKPYLDEDAPVIHRPNVPPRDDNHRQEMIAYFQKKMDERQ
jgi:arylsulfatase A-like enzyme